jgi:YegS C-terminal NAD kinase beta sandwich-like domain
VKPGDPWGEPVAGPADLEVSGGDADLARVVETRRGALVRYRAEPGSDLARAVGIAAASEASGFAAPIDALLVAPGGYAVNGVILGTPPPRVRRTTPTAKLAVTVNGREVASGRATTVVIANGQFFDGLDVVPRGHPGDGRLEVQVYALRRGERSAMRSRLPLGVHLPHPRITTATGREVAVHVESGRLPVTIDGVAHDPVADLTVTLVPAALRLMF